jgi:hypothetical protein
MAKRAGSYIGGSTTLSVRDKDWFSPDKRPFKKAAKRKPSLGLAGRTFEQAKTAEANTEPPRIVRRRKR